METVLTNDNFQHEVLEAAGTVLVDFYADWCGPCKMIAPHVAQLAKDYPALKVCRLNVDTADMPAREYRIRSIPTLLFFRGGEVVKTLIGYASLEELKQEVEAIL